MRRIDLSTATSEILQACESNRKLGRSSPFFFVVGAGISHPPVPLALKIQQECKAVALRYGRTDQPNGSDSIDMYSHWLLRAYPQPRDRQQYLRDLMERAFISGANFRLAHLLLERSITNLVVTTNFDDLLSRALTLFGHRHIVCDHPRTVERVDLESKDMQIIHVHGTYWFYDCCNLRHEIEERSHASADTSVTTSALLDNILLNRSPIVVGYAGWEGDVIMGALKKRLASRLKNNLYWFCYLRGDADRLPVWITKNPDVCLVLPTLHGAGTAPEFTAASIPQDAGSTGIDVAGEPALPATTVFDKLILTFGLDPPRLTTDPLGFLAEQLEQFLSDDTLAERQNDIYAIRGLIHEIQSIKKRLETTPFANRLENSLQQIRDASRRSDYQACVQYACELSLAGATEPQLRELTAILTTAAASLGNAASTADEIRSYDLIRQLLDKLHKTATDPGELNQQLAAVLLKKAIALQRSKQIELALQTYQEIISRFSSSQDTRLHLSAGLASLSKAVITAGEGRLEEAVKLYDEVISHALPDEDDLVARALFNKGLALGRLGRIPEEIAAYDDLLSRCGPEVTESLREPFAKALFNKGIALKDLNRLDDALETYGELLTRFAEISDPRLSEWIARALFNRASIFWKLNQPLDEIAAYDEIASRFAAGASPAIQKRIARALLNKAIALDALGRFSEVVSVCQRLEAGYGDRPDADFAEITVKALFTRALALGRDNKHDEEVAVYVEIEQRFHSTTDPRVTEWVERARKNRQTRNERRTVASKSASVPRFMETRIEPRR